MRKKRTSIRKKISRSFLIVSVISLAVSGVIAVVGMLDIRNLAVNSGNEIGSRAAQSSRDALLNQALSDITALAEAKVFLVDSELGAMARTLEAMADILSGIYRNSENYQNIPFRHPRFNTGQGREMQWTLSPGMTAVSTGLERDLIEAGVLDETFLKGNMEIVFEAVMSSNPNISSIYTQSESGVSVEYDAHSKAKLTGSVATDVFEFRDRPWYIGAKESLHTYVTDAYYDVFGRGLTITISTPYFGKGGEFKGVMGIDIQIDDLIENILSVELAEDDYAVLLRAWDTDDARIIAATGMVGYNQDDLRAFLGLAADEVTEAMRTHRSGVMESALIFEGEESSVHIIWAHVELTGWTYAFVVPAENIIKPSVLIKEYISAVAYETVREADAEIIQAVAALGALLLAVMAAVAFVAMRVSGRITEPITTLAGDIRAIGGGNLDYVPGIRTGDEVEDLSLSFERMTVKLKEYIENLARVTAEKERIGAELDVATKIQTSMLPCIFPPFPERPEFDLYASMCPAKEVGGDFYDFFMVDGNTLAVVIADVSGKGVPAALFMVISKTIIKNISQYGKSPAAILETVNNLLCENNEADMFVTAFYGHLDIPTGKFTFVNAGHNPPLIRKDGQLQWLQEKSGFVLAMMEDISYKQYDVSLNPGDELFLYTDGIVEAMNNEEELFGNERLLNAVQNYCDLPLRDLTLAISREVGDFEEGAEQTDDITMLALRIND